MSPILANLFLHYAFDLWVTRHLPGVRFARYADDAVLHCRSKRQADYVLERIRDRFQACKLELHPGKTRIVYCKDINRTEDHPDVQFMFLGYTFRPRKAVDKYGRVYVNFSPAVSSDALTAASFGKMPTTSLRRLISPLSRSSGLVLCILVRCCAGKPM